MPGMSNSSTSASTRSRLRSTIVTSGEAALTVSPGSAWRAMMTPSIGATMRYLADLGLEAIDGRLGGVAVGQDGRETIPARVRRLRRLARDRGQEPSPAWNRTCSRRRPTSASVRR